MPVGGIAGGFAMPGEPKSRVTILARSTAVSSTPVKPGKTYPLSPLDHAMARHTLHLVFYYPPAAAAAAGMSRNRLKESLSEVLTHYPAVTGRLTRPATEGGNWVVRCNDAGIRVLDARVGCSLEEWLRAAPAAAERELAQWEPMGEDCFIWSPFCIQKSDFECGGVAIGLSCAHMYADATCATLLVKAWGDSHRRACLANPPFFHPPGLRARGPNLNLSTASASFLHSKSTAAPPSPSPAPTSMSTATFRFPDAAVRRCLADLQPACPDATPFDALASLFWWRSKQLAAPAAAPGTSALTVCIDFRKMMHAPLPHGYFGNSLHFSRVAADLGDGWGAAAAALRAHMAGQVEEEFWSAVEWLESRQDAATGAFAPAFQMYGPELTCASLDHLFSYGAAFSNDAAAEGGVGRPAHVAYHVGGVEGEGLILVLPGPPEEGGTMGRTVMVTLPQDQTDKIRRDEVILKLGATLLFTD